MTAYMVAPMPMYRGSKPVRNPKYTRWIKRFPCIACSSSRWVDPCHTGPHAIGQKSSDLNCLPLCRKCHDLMDADPRGFAERNGLDVPALIGFFNHLWELKQARNA